MNSVKSKDKIWNEEVNEDDGGVIHRLVAVPAFGVWVTFQCSWVECIGI